MHGALKTLGDGGGEGASPLHRGEVSGAYSVGEQWCGQQPSGGDGVLNGQVDPDAASRGHGMGGVADAQQAVGVPAVQAVESTMSDKWL